METTLQLTPIIVLSEEEQKKQEEKLLKLIKYYGFTKETYDHFLQYGFFVRPYDLSAKLREKHDEELSLWREKRDVEIRRAKEPLWASDNLTLVQKWEALLSIVIERSDFEFGRNFGLFKHWLAEEEIKEEETVRTYIRDDGNIGVVLHRERVKPSEAQFALQGMLSSLTDEEVKTREENIRRQESLRK